MSPAAEQMLEKQIADLNFKTEEQFEMQLEMRDSDQILTVQTRKKANIAD